MTVPRDDHDQRLGQALRDLGRALPGARRDVAAAVDDALRAERRAHRAPTGGGLPRPARRVVLALTVAALLLAAAVTVRVVVPGVRVDDDTVATAPAPDRPLVRDHTFLGRRTTLDAARVSAGFPIRTPAGRELPAPQVYIAGGGDDTRVTLLYGAHDGLPAMPGTDVGLFVTQFRGDLRRELLAKVTGPDGRVAAVEIDGARGWWVTGVHEVMYLGPDGDVRSDRSRYAGDTLLWTLDGVTLRLETALPRRRAVALAASMHE